MPIKKDTISKMKTKGIAKVPVQNKKDGGDDAHDNKE